MNVQRLRLINKRTSSNCEINDCFLRDLPDCLVDLFNVIWDICDGLN